MIHYTETLPQKQVGLYIRNAEKSHQVIHLHHKKPQRAALLPAVRIAQPEDPWYNEKNLPAEETEAMETGAIIAVVVTLCVAVFAVLICIFSSVSTVSGIKHTNDEDTDA